MHFTWKWDRYQTERILRVTGLQSRVFKLEASSHPLAMSHPMSLCGSRGEVRGSFKRSTQSVRSKGSNRKGGFAGLRGPSPALRAGQELCHLTNNSASQRVPLTCLTLSVTCCQLLFISPQWGHAEKQPGLPQGSDVCTKLQALSFLGQKCIYFYVMTKSCDSLYRKPHPRAWMYFVRYWAKVCFYHGVSILMAFMGSSSKQSRAVRGSKRYAQLFLRPRNGNALSLNEMITLTKSILKSRSTLE